MNTPQLTADELAARVPAHVAQLAVVRALAVAGSEPEWDGGTISRVLDCLDPVLGHLGVLGAGMTVDYPPVPSPYDQDDAAADFWTAVDQS